MLHPYFLKGCTVSFKARMESDPQTARVAVKYTDNEKELMHNGNEWLSPNVVDTKYPPDGVSVRIHPLFH